MWEGKAIGGYVALIALKVTVIKIEVETLRDNVIIYRRIIISKHFYYFSDTKDTHDENVKENITNTTQLVEDNDEAIGFGFFASGFIILITGLLILCILNRVF